MNEFLENLQKLPDNFIPFYYFNKNWLKTHLVTKESDIPNTINMAELKSLINDYCKLLQENQNSSYPTIIIADNSIYSIALIISCFYLKIKPIIISKSFLNNFQLNIDASKETLPINCYMALSYYENEKTYNLVEKKCDNGINYYDYIDTYQNILKSNLTNLPFNKMSITNISKKNNSSFEMLLYQIINNFTDNNLADFYICSSGTSNTPKILPINLSNKIKEFRKNSDTYYKCFREVTNPCISSECCGYISGIDFNLIIPFILKKQCYLCDYSFLLENKKNNITTYTVRDESEHYYDYISLYSEYNNIEFDCGKLYPIIPLGNLKIKNGICCGDILSYQLAISHYNKFKCNIINAYGQSESEGLICGCKINFNEIEEFDLINLLNGKITSVDDSVYRPTIYLLPAGDITKDITINNCNEIHYKNKPTGDLGFIYKDKLYVTGRSLDIIKQNNSEINLCILQQFLQNYLNNPFIQIDKENDNQFSISIYNENELETVKNSEYLYNTITNQIDAYLHLINMNISYNVYIFSNSGKLFYKRHSKNNKIITSDIDEYILKKKIIYDK